MKNKWDVYTVLYARVARASVIIMFTENVNLKWRSAMNPVAAYKQVEMSWSNEVFVFFQLFYFVMFSNKILPKQTAYLSHNP